MAPLALPASSAATAGGGGRAPPTPPSSSSSSRHHRPSSSFGARPGRANGRAHQVALPCHATAPRRRQPAGPLPPPPAPLLRRRDEGDEDGSGGDGSDGRQAPPSSSQQQRRPEWVRMLEADADVDEDVAALLEGTDGDPELIRNRMAEALARPPRTPPGLEDEGGGSGGGSGGDPTDPSTLVGGAPPLGCEAPPTVVFRDVDTFDLWLWFEFADPSTGGPRRAAAAGAEAAAAAAASSPRSNAVTPRERDALDALLRAWFVLGKMGGFDSANLQASQAADGDVSFLDYEQPAARAKIGGFGATGGGLSAAMHAMGPLEVRGAWARVNVDMGTADEIGLDVLINALVGLSRDVAALRTIYVGGENSDWPLVKEDEQARGSGRGRGGGDGEGPDPGPRRGRPRASAATARGVWPFEDGAGRAEEEEGEEEQQLGGGGDDDEEAGDGRDPYAGIGARVGAAPRVGMDPMHAPSGLDEELELAEEMLAEQQQQQQQAASSSPGAGKGQLFGPEDFKRGAAAGGGGAGGGRRLRRWASSPGQQQQQPR